MTSRILARVTSSYLLLFALMTLIAGAGAYSVVRVQSEHDLIIDNEVSVVMAAQNVRFLVARLRQKEKSAFLAIGRPAEKYENRGDSFDKEAADFDVYFDELVKELRLMSELNISYEEVGMTAGQLIEESYRYHEVIHSIFKDVRAGRIKTSWQADDALVPHKKWVKLGRDWALKIARQSKKNLERSADDVENKAKTILFSIVFLFVAATLIGLSSLFFSRKTIVEYETRNTELNDELEHRVKDRTQELEETNRDLSATLAELEKTILRLEHARDELVRSERLASLGSLVAGVAHELNTPIGVAVLASSTLLDLTKKFKASAETGLSRSVLNEYIESSLEGNLLIARNLDLAAERIRSFKQLSVDQTSEQRRAFEMKEIVEEVLETMRPALKRTSHQVKLGVSEGLVLDSYPGLIGQLVMNLINNALMHGFEGKENGEIRIDARALDEEFFELRVADNGIGMSAEVAAQVFDPFFTTKLGHGGSGLGMHIAYSIVTKNLGGSIRLETRPGEGAMWVIVLRRVAPQPEVSGVV